MAAYPASKGQLTEKVKEHDNKVWQMRSTLVSHNALMSSSAVDAQFVLGIHRMLRREQARITALKDVSGIADEIKRQKNDQNLDAVQALIDLVGLLDSAADWIQSNIYRVDGSEYLEVLILDAGAMDVTWRTFSSAETAPLRNRLSAIINGIS